MKTSWYNRIGFLLVITAAFLLTAVWAALNLELLPFADAFFKDGQSDAPSQEAEGFLILEADCQITANKATILWPQGAVLEPGKAEYYYAAQPSVQITPSLYTENMGRGELSGLLVTKCFLQAQNEKGAVYWNYLLQQLPAEPVLLSVKCADKPDTTVYRAAAVSFDAAAINDKLSAICDELDFHHAVFTLAVQTEVNLQGTLDDVAAQRVLLNNFALTLKEEGFSLPETEEGAARVTLDMGGAKTPAQQHLWRQTLSDAWLPVFLNISLLLLLIYLLQNRKKRLKPDDYEHKRFKEWITEGSIQLQDRVPINVHSLAGLVDLAIDLDKRVIFDPDTKKYYVLEENLVYVYDPGKHDPVKAHHPVGLNSSRLGKLLLERGVISPEHLERGLFYQQQTGRLLGESLMSLGLIDEISLTAALASQAQLPFLELNPEQIKIDPALSRKITVNQARALSTVPLGIRKDGRLVVAYAGTFNRGFEKNLEELYAEKLFIVAARPSSVRKLIDQMEPAPELKKILGHCEGKKEEKIPSSLSSDEQTRFVLDYYQGSLNIGLFLQAADMLPAEVKEDLKQSAGLLPWLVNHSQLDGVIANLLWGIKRALPCMEGQAREEKQPPNLLDMLRYADHLTASDIARLQEESRERGVPPEDILIESFLITADTFKKAIWLLDKLDCILKGDAHQTAC